MTKFYDPAIKLMLLLFSVQGQATVIQSICHQHLTQAFAGKASVTILKQNADKRVAIVSDSEHEANKILAVTLFKHPIAPELSSVHEAITMQRISIGVAFQQAGFQIERRVVGSLPISLPHTFQKKHPTFAQKTKMKLVEFWVTKNGSSSLYATIGEIYSEDFSSTALQFDTISTVETIPTDKSEFTDEIAQLK